MNRGVNSCSIRSMFNSKTNNEGLCHLRVKRKVVRACKNLGSLSIDDVAGSENVI